MDKETRVLMPDVNARRMYRDLNVIGSAKQHLEADLSEVLMWSVQLKLFLANMI